MAQRASQSRIVAATALITLGIATLASMVLLSAQRVEAITPPVDPAPETPAYSVTMVDLPDTIDSPSLNVSGTATPLENITVQAIGGNDADVFCNTAADAEGNWGCTVAFSYNDGIEIQAYRTGLSTYYLEDFAHDFLGYVSPAGIDQTWGNLYWNGYFTYGVYGDKGVGSDVQILLDGESVECDFYDPWAGAQPTKWYCELSGGEVGWDLGSYTLTAVTSVTDGANTWQGASADATLIVDPGDPFRMGIRR